MSYKRYCSKCLATESKKWYSNKDKPGWDLYWCQADYMRWYNNLPETKLKKESAKLNRELTKLEAIGYLYGCNKDLKFPKDRREDWPNKLAGIG